MSAEVPATMSPGYVLGLLRQIDDLQEANTRYLLRARAAEARVVELEAALKEQAERITELERIRDVLFDANLDHYKRAEAAEARATAAEETLAHIIREESEHGYTVEARMHAMARYAKSFFADRPQEGTQE